MNINLTLNKQEFNNIMAGYYWFGGLAVCVVINTIMDVLKLLKYIKLLKFINYKNVFA